MTKKKRNIIIIAVVILFLLYALLQTGIVFFSTPAYSSSKGIKNYLALADAYSGLNEATAVTSDTASYNRVLRKISADAAIVYDLSLHKIVFAKNIDKQEYPASMTKMMTCILAIESGKLESVAKVGKSAALASYTYLSEGDQLSLSELLYMLMLSSNNGAAITIADHLTTPRMTFISLMNRKARELGMTSTHFINPNGMHEVNHYSSARDMAKLATYCMRNSVFRGIVNTTYKRVVWKFPRGKHMMCHNENHLLGLYDGVNGVKTGYTKQAQGCLATSFEKNNTKFITIVLHSRNAYMRFVDSKTLIDWKLGYNK
jgi:D-alanyl-D-alanine carboxypeptidase (penicillin-binding protein 5/6)